MRISWISTALVLLVSSSFVSPKSVKRSYLTHNYYVLEHDPEVSGVSLDDLARELIVEVVEQVGELRNHWLVRTEKSVEARTTKEDAVLARYHQLRARGQTAIYGRSEDAIHSRKVASAIKYLSLQIPRQRVKRAPPPIPPPSPNSAHGVADRLGILDPRFPDQWHLVNDEEPANMMNVTRLWESGYTGKGVISSLIDDGLDYTSDDLADNFDADDSYDYNDHEDLPTPKLFDDTHGTRCAGQIAAVKNGVCGVGIAYDSKVAGVRILSGPLSDADEAAALNYGYQNVSIYSCSWGPPDNGRTMEGPDLLIRKAMLNGINNGRGGKGSVFVFASGNGAASGDQCNFDGYTNSIYSVTVSAIDHKNQHPTYSESCAANMIVAYSSGSGKAIVTTDKGKDKCTQGHGGTSAAAPNAVGVFALALQARPDLTWRDIQHLCVRTARVANEDDDWEYTAAGRLYSYKYGYGVLDGYRFVNAALAWPTVKPQTWFKTHTVQLGNGTMSEDQVFSGGVPITEEGVRSTITVAQETLQQNNFEALEHINVRVWIQHARRGDVEVEIVSPKGVASVLAQVREFDKADTGFPGWTFMSVKHWDEDPVGDWTIRVSDPINPDQNGSFLGWDIMFWGSTIDPARATKYELPPDDSIFPPHEDAPPSPLPSPTTTRVYTKPTHFLPSPTASEEEEQEDDTLTSPTVTSTPGHSFPGLGKLISEQKWFFGAIGLVFVVGIGAAIFFWRRHARARKANYEALSNDDMQMRGIRSRGTTPRSREMYDAFDEGTDSEEEADEQTALRSGHGTDRIGSSGAPEQYHDEPEPHVEGQHSNEDVSSNGSGDGSWEHAEHGS